MPSNDHRRHVPRARPELTRETAVRAGRVGAAPRGISAIRPPPRPAHETPASARTRFGREPFLAALGGDSRRTGRRHAPCSRRAQRGPRHPVIASHVPHLRGCDVKQFPSSATGECGGAAASRPPLPRALRRRQACRRSARALRRSVQPHHVRRLGQRPARGRHEHHAALGERVATRFAP
jgi:hypothetical protein